jgi:hypothetical protein
VNYAFPKPQSPTPVDFGNGPVLVGGNQLRAFDATNGFALHWAGVNASVAPEPVGGTISLRFGPSTTLYNTTDASAGLQYVKQAFASWKPGGADGTVTIDFGKYDQPYGSEVADSQANINYTRSILYWYAQPLFFTGVRVDWAPTKLFDLKLFATNGWNASIDPNAGKSVGLQVNLAPSDKLLVAAGYMLGPEQGDWTSCPNDTAYGPSGCTAAPGRAGGLVERGVGDTSLRHLVDLIVDANPTKKLRLLFNGDFLTEEVHPPTTTASYRMQVYGANLAARYALGDVWGIGLRGEYFHDKDGVATGLGETADLVDGTLTIAATPTSNLILKLDNRADVSLDGKTFQRGVHEMSKVQITSTLGVVATTN